MIICSYAKLRQKALSSFKSDEIATWPKSINDATLSELATYYEQSSIKANTWNTIGHDWMVKNIDDMAKSIQEYVKTFYHETYAKDGLGDNLEAYRSLALKGLQGSTYYNEKVSNDFNNHMRLLQVTGCGN